MSTPRAVALPLLILAVSVSACGSSSSSSSAPHSTAFSTATTNATSTSGAAGGAGMPGMQMGSMQPENVAGALAALQAHNSSSAAHDLRAALASKHEPAAAKHHARQALALVARRKQRQAENPAAQGAAVEHLTYALAALTARDPKTAAGHLMEAKALPPAAGPAKQALAAINAHHDARAASIVRKALHGLGA